MSNMIYTFRNALSCMTKSAISPIWIMIGSSQNIKMHCPYVAIIRGITNVGMYNEFIKNYER